MTSLPLFADANVPSAVTSGLRRIGLEVLTAQDDGTDAIPDPELLERTVILERILLTHDRDFEAIAAEFNRNGRFFPGIILFPQRGMGTGAIIDEIELIALGLEPFEIENQVYHLPLAKGV